MTTYSAYYDDGTPVFKNIPACDVYNVMPSNRIISGDRLDKESGKVIAKAVFESRKDGRRFTLQEDKPIEELKKVVPK